MGKAEDGFLARARELWGNHAGRPITDDEAPETIENMAAFAELIIDWCVTDRESCDRFLAKTSAAPDAPPSCRE
jgi:hypothetical protein